MNFLHRTWVRTVSVGSVGSAYRAGPFCRCSPLQQLLLSSEDITIVPATKVPVSASNREAVNYEWIWNGITTASGLNWLGSKPVNGCTKICFPSTKVPVNLDRSSGLEGKGKVE